MHHFNAVNVSDGDIAMSNQKECTYKIKFGFSEYRKMKGVKRLPKPVKRSRYAQSLWDEGAGWNDDSKLGR